MTAPNRNPKVDAYIEKARPFAQPILAHLRKAIHAGCPGIEETIKWSRPFFEYRGTIVCNISGFKEHCSLGFWGLEIGAILRKAGVVRDGAMGSLGRITSIASLPPEKKIIEWVSAGRRHLSKAAGKEAPSRPALASSSRPTPPSRLRRI